MDLLELGEKRELGVKLVLGGGPARLGLAGPSMNRSEILAVVDAELFRQIRTQLDLQLRRMAQMQAQLNRVTNLVGGGSSRKKR